MISNWMKTSLLAASAMAATLAPSLPARASEGNGQEKTEIMTPEILWSMGRIGGTSASSISPDRKEILYTVTYTDWKTEESHTRIYISSTTPGADDARLLGEGSQPVWIKDGTKVAFLSGEGGQRQIWEMNPDGSGRRKLSAYMGNIDGFAFSPDGKKVLFTALVQSEPTTEDLYPDLPKASGRIANDLMYLHWDEWVDKVPHPFWAPFDGETVGAATDLLKGELYESPMKPFGGIEQLAWVPTSEAIVYTCRKKRGIDYTLSTNSDIYIYDLSSGLSRNLTLGNGGYDQNPVFNPVDSTQMAWLSMARDGYESDLNRLCVLNIYTRAPYFLSHDFASNVENMCWSRDGKTIYFTGVWHGTKHLYALDMKTEKVRAITSGHYDYSLVGLGPDGSLIASRHSLSAADELYNVEIKTGEARPITSVNRAIFDRLKLGRVEERWLTTTDGKQMLVWVVFPPEFDPQKKYPAVLYCEGGPQSPVTQFWSYRWNIQTLAAAGYIYVLPNRRGMPGFGPEWNEAISGDYGGQCMRDYLTAIDSIAAEPYVDAERLGCVGASFGGFSVYWLAGHHEKRFKAFIAHDGLFNLEQQYVETDEKWFPNWDLGGPYWEAEKNETIRNSYAQSPHRFVEAWDTPILCIHGVRDYRVLASQGMSAFSAARLRGLPAQLLLYPDENHWVLRPQNSILWYRTFNKWLDRWLKQENPQ